MRIHSRHRTPLALVLVLAGLASKDAAGDTPGEFLYTAGHGFGQVCGYKVDPATGSLSPVPGNPFPFPGHPLAVAADAAGRFLYATNESGALARYSIDAASGMLLPAPGSPFGFQADLEGLAVSPTGRFLYVADPLNEIVRQYRVGLKIAGVSQLPATPVGNNVFAVAVHPSGAFLYATTAAPDGQLFAFAVHPVSGALTPAPGSPYLEGSGKFTLNIAVHPSGRYVYAVNAGADEVTGYAIDGATGSLDRLSGAPFPTGGSAPQFLTVSRSGRYLYATNTSSNTVSGFAIDPDDGNLTALPGSPYPTGAAPEGLVVDSADHYLYLVTATGESVWIFAVDPDTGELSPTAGSPFPGGCHGWGVTLARPMP